MQMNYSFSVIYIVGLYIDNIVIYWLHKSVNEKVVYKFG